jgi:hypothetical protein
MLQGAYRSFGGERSVCGCRRVAVCCCRKNVDVQMPSKQSQSISDSNYHEMSRRSIDFNPDRERLCVQYSHQTLPTSRRAIQSVTLSPSLSRRCHTATANATAKVRSQERARNCDTQEAKSPKAAPGAKPSSALTQDAHSLGFALSRFRSCKQKPFLRASASTKSGGGRYNIRQPVGARAATTRRRNTARLVVVLRATHDLTSVRT